MAQKTLPLEPVVNIIVNLSARAAVRKGFDLALLVGERPQALESEQRVDIFSGVSEMLEAGFTTEDRLYQAAALLFGQNKKPTRVAIGYIAEVTEEIPEEVPPAEGDGKTDTPEAGGDTPETGSETPSPEETGDTPSGQSDAGVTLVTRRETPVETIAACREANGEWYVAIYCADATDDERLEVAGYIQSVKPYSLYAYTTDDERALTNADENIFARMKAKNYRRAIGQYSSKHKDAVAAITGFAMGSMTGTIGSAFTLAYKTEVGVETENSSGAFSSQYVENIKANNGNVFINRGTYYDVFEEGTMADGTWFDEMIYLDKYANDMQLAIMDLLYQNQKIAQTEAGMTRIHSALTEVCEEANKVGFIESGVWKSNDLLELKYGDTLPKGYLIQSESIDAQAQADREARKAPPIYVSFKLAGAIHHVTVEVDVNR